MRTPTRTFRLSPGCVKMMDGLITNPPSIAIDADLGKPRNRTELVETLVKKAYAVMKEGKEAAKKSA